MTKAHMRSRRYHLLYYHLPRRVRMKAPAVSKVDGDYLQNEVLYEVPNEEDVIEEEERGLKYLRNGEIQVLGRR